mgnify:FL=1
MLVDRLTLQKIDDIGRNIMNDMSIKEQMMQLTKQCILSNDDRAMLECLQIYKSSFGYDDFYITSLSSLRITPEPLVSLIYIKQPDEDEQACCDNINRYNNYQNLEITVLSADNLLEDFYHCFTSMSGQYICFCDCNHKYDSNRIRALLLLLSQNDSVDGVVCSRNFIEADNTILAHPERIYREVLDEHIFGGNQLLTYSIENDVNIYGDLSTLLLSMDYVKTVPFFECDIPDSMQQSALLYQLLYSAKVLYTYMPLVSAILTPALHDAELVHDFQKFLNIFQNQLLEHTSATVNNFSQTENFVPCKKDITFFYTDMGEYYNLKPIADEAEARGYRVSFTRDIFAPAEIGVYCQHVCHPENSRFSVILLHDLAQGHKPNIWEYEPWNKFDIGILPGKFWNNLWSRCAFNYYVNPRCGTYEFGYPKSDLVSSPELAQRVSSLKEKLNLKYDISILYAPSWENDGKEDDFIKALSSLNVNLLIKQADWSEVYSNITENIRQMRELHEGKYENVYYIEPQESIMTALAMSDIIVSDESNVMAEALMFGKLSIAVADWLIPDCTPSRYANPMDYVIKTTKKDLRKDVERFLSSPKYYSDFFEKGRELFSNAGNCCVEILDAIGYFTSDKHSTSTAFLKKRMSSKYSICSLWN